MFSPRTLTALLIVTIAALSYQTYVLAALGDQLSVAQINLGGSTAISLGSDGSVPDMVGGC